jgi:hypothetical protein
VTLNRISPPRKILFHAALIGIWVFVSFARLDVYPEPLGQLIRKINTVTDVSASTCPQLNNTLAFTIAYGSATLNGSAAPVGSLVKAVSPRGDIVGCFEVTQSGYYGGMYIYGEDTSVTPAIPGMRTGEAVNFVVEGGVAVPSPSLTWTNDRDFHSVNLSATLNTLSFPLSTGWNLASFNLKPGDPTISSVLSSIAGSYDLVYAWNGQNQTWQKFDPNAPPYSNSLQTLDEKRGFWIHMLSPATLVISGSPPATTSIDLYAAGRGWNLVGYPSVTNRDLPAAFQNNGAGTDFSLVYAYHPADPDRWKLFDRSAPPYSNDLATLAPGWGYWVRVSAAHTWTVSYP